VNTPEHSHSILTSLETTIQAAVGTNEATTRLRAIDSILFDVLGWSRTSVETERYCRCEGYSDYALFHGNDLALIIEAKRDRESFLLPDLQFPDTPVAFSLLAKECPAAEKALRQALGYAAAEGARYIAITNGHQWLMGLTFVPNQKIEQRSVFVFESYRAIRDTKFRTFFNCFSPEAICGNRPSQSLIESRKALAPPKLSASIINYPVAAGRNVIANELYVSTATVLEEVRSEETSEQFLTACYVTPQQNAGVLTQTRELISQRLSLDQHSRSIPGSSIESVIDKHSPEKPVIVLGKVGHGKSTFLRYLRRVQAKDLLEQYIQIDVNFIDRPETPEQVGPYIYKRIEEQLLEEYQTDIHANNLVRGFLHGDIERFKRSYEGQQYAEGTEEYKAAERHFVQQIRNDPHVYLTRVFEHLRRGRIRDGKGHSVAIFLDNLDRRIDSIQEEAFLRASAMARDWAAVLFVCLRPGTFYRSAHFGVLDSVAPLTVTVTSPKTHLLVSKRLKYAKKVALGIAETKRGNSGGSFGKDLSLELPSVAEFLESIADSFWSSRALSDLFDAVSNGNARDLLQYVHRVLTSMHLDTRKILAKIKKGGYQMPVHEALRALLYGDSLHYDPERSIFINVFDIARSDPAEHFSRLLILRHLLHCQSGPPNYGYATVSQVVSTVCQIGFSDQHVAEGVEYLFEKGCLESKLSYDRWDRSIDVIRLTARGRYTVTTLVRTFNYVDAVCVDTPIVVDTFRDVLQDVLAIRDRLNRCRVFLKYLDQCAQSLADSQSFEFWVSISRDVQDEIARVESKL